MRRLCTYEDGRRPQTKNQTVSGWIAMHRSQDGQDLMESHPNAFLLLCQIAFRVRWKDHPNGDLKRGQCYVGDFKKAGISTEMAYRHAKKILEKSKIATFKGTNKGTVATLIDQAIFGLEEIPATGTATDKERPRNDQGTTKYKDTKKEGKERGTLEQFREYAISQGLPETDGESMFLNYESNGWKNGKTPVKDWRMAFQKWKLNHWHPSQKAQTLFSQKDSSKYGI